MAQQPGQEELAKQYAQVVAKAWADPAFKERLLADPATVLKEHGIAVSAGQEVQVVEQQPDELLLVLPPRPAALADE